MNKVLWVFVMMVFLLTMVLLIWVAVTDKPICEKDENLVLVGKVPMCL